MRNHEPGVRNWWLFYAAFLLIALFVVTIAQWINLQLPAGSMKRLAVLTGLGLLNLIAADSVEKWIRRRWHHFLAGRPTH